MSEVAAAAGAGGESSDPAATGAQAAGAGGVLSATIGAGAGGDRSATVAARAVGEPSATAAAAPAAATAGRVLPDPTVLAEVRFSPDGLVPAVVQDAADGRVLMVAYMDAEALAATVETGEVHFHSRSRDRLWRKGETSGNVLRLVDLAVDCDGDAVLVTVDPSGPTCHRGTRSCFDRVDATATPVRSRVSAPVGTAAAARASSADEAPAPSLADPATQGFVWLETLWSTIMARAAERPTGSYTTSLLDGGVDAVGRKVTEEATELLLAAKDHAAGSTPATREALASEAADLLYHALVLLAERDVPPTAVIEILRARHSA